MTSNTTKPTSTPKPAPKPAPAKARKEYWLKDKTKNNSWVIMSIPECDYTQKAVELLKSHGETNIQVIQHNESSAQQAIARGLNYSPCIHLNGKVIGSLGELENYYKRNFFSNIREATQ